MTVFADIFDGADVISHYGRAQAIEDGALVSIPAQYLAIVNVKAPLAVTIGLWQHVNSEDPDTLRDNILRLLVAASRSFRSGDTSDMMRTDIDYRGIKVWGVIDGDGVCLMLPEDY